MKSYTNKTKRQLLEYNRQQGQLEVIKQFNYVSMLLNKELDIENNKN